MEAYAMQTKISPGGSRFPYYYKGGEIHCLKYGSFHADEEALLAVMKAEEIFIANPNQQLLVWVDFYETKLTHEVLSEFSESMNRLRPHIIKLAIVGCSVWDQYRLYLLSREAGRELPTALKFFSDPEVAKTWLVSESF
jgi:hypothetical protein